VSVLHVGPLGVQGGPQIGSEEADSVTVSHPDIVLAQDTNPLTDLGQAFGTDNGTDLGLELTFPASVCVVPPPVVVGCRITGGGSVNGMLDPNTLAEITKAQFAGQVGAPCGCFGCFDKFDPKLASVQGNWSHKRKNKGGSMHAKTFNSLVCDCLGGNSGPGTPCLDAEHPLTEADHICITGVADFIPDSGNKKPIPVAFRFEATDHGEPGRADFYEMHILKPSGQLTVAAVAKAICCTKPYVQPGNTTAIANDSGNLVTGNIQIHPALKRSLAEECPPPDGVCEPLP
jgi:hypothetical protein